MFGSLYKSPAEIESLARIRAWTRERFSLPADASVFPAELRCAQPGCPPLETVVVFWHRDAVRYRFKIFKAARDVIEDDLPIAWLLPALIDDGQVESCC
jgi:hypothetical protein